MGKIIAISNQKGGVGKTTTSVNLSACVAEAGKRTLLVDIDPQGNATSGLGVETAQEAKTIYEVLLGEAEAKDACVDTGFDGLMLIPASIELAGAEVELVGLEGREGLLKTALEPLRDSYDYIFIDCPPSLGLLTLNALTAADSVLVPIQCEYYALEGVGQLMNTVKLVRKKTQPRAGGGGHRSDHVRRPHQPRRAGGHGSAQPLLQGGVCNAHPPQRAPERSAQLRHAHSPLRWPLQRRGGLPRAGQRTDRQK